MQETNLNTPCFASASTAATSPIPTATTTYVSNLLQINTADSFPTTGTNNYLLSPTTTSGYPTASACQIATAALATTTLTSTASRPAYTSSCVPLVNQVTGVAVTGYYTRSVLSSTSQVPTNGYVAALTYQVRGS